MRRVKLSMSPAPSYALTSPSVRPAAMPIVWPAGPGGKKKWHCRVQYSGVTRRETMVGRSPGAPSGRYPKGSLQSIHSHCRWNVLLSEASRNMRLSASYVSKQ